MLWFNLREVSCKSVVKVEEVQGWRSVLSKFSGLFKVALLFIAALVLFKGYGLWQYHHPTPELAAMRQEKIMQYQTSDLKKVYDYEDRGGRDWKGNYNAPYKVIEFESTSHKNFEQVSTALQHVALESEWVNLVKNSTRISFKKGDEILSLSSEVISSNAVISVRIRRNE